MAMKSKMTSGLMQSLILFAQITTLINLVPSPPTLSQTSQIFLSIHVFIFRFSFEYFILGELSFCRWSGARVMDNLAFRYTTTIFSPACLYWWSKINHKDSLLQKNNEHGKEDNTFSIVYGISTFLILSYTQYTLTDSHSNPCLWRRWRDSSFCRVSSRWYGVSYLPYAIPAVIILLFFSIPPPLLLISYPLVWKIKAKVKCNAKKVWKENDATI